MKHQCKLQFLVDGSGSPRLYWAALVIIGSLSFAMQKTVASMGLDLHHDTFMFDAARRLLHGDVPFRDFFFQYNLGTTFYHALALKFFGEKILSLKIATAIAFSSVSVFIYASIIQEKGWKVAFICSLAWTLLSPFYMPAMNGYHPWSTVYMMATIMGGLTCLLIAFRHVPFWWAVGAGVQFNLAFWFKQVAALQILGVAGCLIWYIAVLPSGDVLKRRIISIFLGYAAGGLISSLPFFLYLAGNHAFLDWWHSAFVFNGEFAATSNSVTGFVPFLRNLLPVARDLGFTSFVWAVLPVYVAGWVYLQFAVSDRAVKVHSVARIQLRLLATLGLVGWFEYFPLAHSFHTHLFMAPTFVFLAFTIGAYFKAQNVPLWKALVARALVVVVLFAISYEVVWHLRGFRGKILDPTVSIERDIPAAGLALKPEAARSFDRFYLELLRAKQAFPSEPIIPLSVDPLRALLPSPDRDSQYFKMGVDWTWPNELVEPGFNERVNSLITRRAAPAYADTLINLPGYIPVAILEMPSPITETHTLYQPSADVSVRATPTYVIDNVPLFESPDYLGRPYVGLLIPPNELQGIKSDQIAQIHILIVRDSDLPKRISKNEYQKYILPITRVLPETLSWAQMFTLSAERDYIPQDLLLEDQYILLAKFMMRTGKLYGKQNPRNFISTLSSSPNRQPILMYLAPNAKVPCAYWENGGGGFRTMGSLHCNTEYNTSYSHFFGIPKAEYTRLEPTTFFVQIVEKDNTTRSFYIRLRGEP